MRPVRLELTRLTALEPKSSASANSATGAHPHFIVVGPEKVGRDMARSGSQCTVPHALKETAVRGGGLRRLAEVQIAQQAANVAGGLDVVLGRFDGAISADEEGGADHALDDLAVVLLLAEGAVGGHDLL